MTRENRVRRRPSLFAGLALVALMLPNPMAPSVIIVTSTSDDGAGSLRQAVRDVPAGGMIAFSPGLLPATITLGSGEIALARSVTIAGPGAELLTISGGDLSRVFAITAITASVSISGVTVAHGRVTGNPAEGGAIRNSGDLVLQRVVIISNRAEGAGASGSEDAFGGGFFNAGSASLVDSTVMSNTAQGAPMTGNYGGDGNGGGVHNQGILTMTRTTISQNLAKGGTASVRYGGSGFGGGVSNAISGTLTIEDSVLRQNRAEGAYASDRYGGAGYGGGLRNSGLASIQRSEVLTNTATGGGAYRYGGEGYGGGVSNPGLLALVDGAVRANLAQGTAAVLEYAGSAEGGGINSRGFLTITRGTLVGNVARGATGAVAGAGDAGGVYALGRLNIENSTLADNQAQGGVGTYWAYGKVGGDASAGALYSYAFGGVEHVVISSTFCNNLALGGTGESAGDADAGGVYGYFTLTLQSSIIYSNAAIGGLSTANGSGGDAAGGGAYGLGALTLRDSTVQSNTARGGSGNGYSYGGNGAGGGVFESYNGAIRIERTLLLSNTARGGDSASSRGGTGYGGAFSDSGSSYSPTARLVNCTLAGNRAARGAGSTAGALGTGGGLRAGYAAVEVSFCTVTGNIADDRGGGLFSVTADDDQGPMIKNSILHGNLAPNGPDVYANVQSRGYNLVGAIVSATLDITGGANTGIGNLIGIDPKLGPLGDNGGPTWTRALATGAEPSPALDAASGTDVSGQTVMVDQRGFFRPFPPGRTADIGAYEWGTTVYQAFLPIARR